ncbi:glycoside hydrolase family 127 protein [Chitinophaga japonensis]|uniref:Uncharacterized protein n=1 Tax=Chitinophaga japonensis TaxID=104662 RepID=A0A562T4X5_CHIJA|nr:glycoside hydrolase family 127 protein [Chitinophaga japonensis]TWI88585.1 hypothetical protein LX66_2671 [Chitinophaga japonensis]
MSSGKWTGWLLTVMMTTFVSHGYGQQQAALFPLSAVRLLESPFLQAQQTDAQYILSLDEDRLLAPFLKDAGIRPLKENYGNWESDGLDGHIAGHYLTAAAQMYAATGDTVFRNRLNYMLDWLEKCQQQNGNGYVGGIPDGKQVWQQVAQGRVEAVWQRWVPWYNLHKLYAGLVDAYQLTGSEQAKRILIGLSDWCLRLTDKLSDGQMQRMLGNEHGGMNEVFANVSRITGDERYMTLARRFSHRAILDPLLEHQDSLTGLHANTQIPKVVGFARIAALTGDKAWADAAEFFWNTVTLHRSVSFGGNSVREHFNSPDDFSPMLESREGPETCNSYNMLKLTKALFLANPDAKYIHYYERTLYNHILSSQHPEGGFVYFTPIRPAHYRVYSSSQQCFWCCVGSGIENHGKYGELIYAHHADELYVNLFIPSVLQWKQRALELSQETRFPFETSSTLKFSTQRPQRLVVKLRQPDWIAGAFEVQVNGKPVKLPPARNGYVSIARTWKNGDRITVRLPMRTTAEVLPDSSQWVSFVHGPLVLAAAAGRSAMPGLKADSSRWGHIAHGRLEPLEDAPLLVMEDPAHAPMPRETDTAGMVFGMAHLVEQAKYKNLELTPFFQLHDRRYILYWPYAAAEEVPGIKAAIRQKEQARRQKEEATVDVVYPGEQQPEADHQFKGGQTRAGFFRERHYRSGKDWFSYVLSGRGTTPAKLSITCYGAEKDRSFDIYVNDSRIGAITLTGEGGNAFKDHVFDLPAGISGGEPLTILFKARSSSAIGRIFEVRLLK